MHSEAQLTLEDLLKSEPVNTDKKLDIILWLCVGLGVLTFLAGLLYSPAGLFWGAYYSNLLFFTGLSAGSVIIAVIVQIVRAKWVVPVRRLAEANVAFFPWALIGLLVTYAGKEYLFPWARAPLPGREWWMQADFVYLRYLVLLSFLFFLLWRFVRLSLRGDIGIMRERNPSNERWQSIIYDGLLKNWKGAEKEVLQLQRKMSWNAPLLIALYAVIYSLFVFEMLMAMDPIWYSNMFGGFQFIGNIYMAWAVLALAAICLAKNNAQYANIISVYHLWDVGKLMLGFCMLWAYMFFSQFLPQWYGNLPEETQWLILRTREMPWMGFAWFTFAAAFIVPFVLLLSDDVKRTPKAFAIVCCLSLIGMWCEKYSIIMPFLSEHSIPFGFLEAGLFLGFFGAYLLSLRSFYSKYPLIGLSHPITYGDSNW